MLGCQAGRGHKAWPGVVKRGGVRLWDMGTGQAASVSLSPQCRPAAWCCTRAPTPPPATATCYPPTTASLRRSSPRRWPPRPSSPGHLPGPTPAGLQGEQVTRTSSPPAPTCPGKLSPLGMAQWPLGSSVGSWQALGLRQTPDSNLCSCDALSQETPPPPGAKCHFLP